MTVVATLVVATLLGCSDEVELPAPSREAVHVTDGYWPVVQINDRLKKAGPCTGVLVSEEAVLSAAHCFPIGRTDIEIGNDYFEAIADVVELMVPPSRESNSHDIAILKITSITKGTPTFYPIGSHIDIRNLIRLVGYGHLYSHRDFAKRTGTNIIFEKNDFLEIQYAEPAQGVRGAYNRAGGTEGDSGGPFLLYENGQYYVVGLVQSRDTNRSKTYGVDLTRPENRAFIQKANREHNLKIRAF